MNIRKRDTIRGTQKVEARQILDLAHVAWDTPCGKIEAEHFAHALNININMFEIHHTFKDVLYSTDLKPDCLYEVDLLYNSVTKHYDYITNIDGVLQSIRNKNTVFAGNANISSTMSNTEVMV